MTLRDFEAHMYRVPDPSDTRIPDLELKVRELEAALLEANDAAAKLRHIALGVIGANYNLDHEHAEGFLARWVADPSAWPAGERP
jgi:hypothetical protein